jgi:hypothetical protein
MRPSYHFDDAIAAARQIEIVGDQQEAGAD